MFCPKCGNEVSENFEFCPKCSHSLKNISSVNTQNKISGNETMMTKDEFIYSKPHLKAKMDTIKKSKIYTEIWSAIVLVVVCVIVYNDFQNAWTNDFFKWMFSAPQHVLIPFAIAFILIVLASLIISLLYAKNPQKEIDNEYEEYCSKFENERHKFNIDANDSQWECPECGTLNSGNASICSQCGYYLNLWVCPKCGKKNISVSDIDTCSCGYSPLE